MCCLFRCFVVAQGVIFLRGTVVLLYVHRYNSTTSRRSLVTLDNFRPLSSRSTFCFTLFLSMLTIMWALLTNRLQKLSFRHPSPSASSTQRFFCIHLGRCPMRPGTGWTFASLPLLARGVCTPYIREQQRSSALIVVWMKGHHPQCQCGWFP